MSASRDAVQLLLVVLAALCAEERGCWQALLVAGLCVLQHAFAGHMLSARLSGRRCVLLPDRCRQCLLVIAVGICLLSAAGIPTEAHMLARLLSVQGAEAELGLASLYSET